MPATKMAARFAGKCCTCGQTIEKGSEIFYWPEQVPGKRVWHADCAAPESHSENTSAPLNPEELARLLMSEIPPEPNSPETSDPNYNDPQDPFVRRSELMRELAKLNTAITQGYTGATRNLNNQLANQLEELEKRVQSAGPAKLTIQREGVEFESITLEKQHKNFEKLLRLAQTRTRDGQKLNIFIHGPAGTGKSTAARNVALALNLPFYFTGAIADESKLVGYTDAHGQTVSRPFREAFTSPSVFCFDEVDGSSPGAVLPFNAALANGAMDFPDAILTRHPDSIIIATANSTGLGSDMEYIARLRQDKAFTDRFVFLHWPIDEGFEDALCADKLWLRIVREARQQVTKYDSTVITPRTTFQGEAIIAAGFSYAEAVEMTMTKVLDADNFKQLFSALKSKFPNELKQNA